MPNFISEDNIEQAILQWLQFVHGYDRALFTEKRDSVLELVLDLAEHGSKWAA
ncbi:MAG: hypothetical protein NTV46_12755 [Verrucomicrobia bacterium]|nr:hypothetical protein [Verrucomicrobiota bacterium]